MLYGMPLELHDTKRGANYGAGMVGSICEAGFDDDEDDDDSRAGKPN